MAVDTDTQWLVDLHEENAATLHRLAALLGASGQSTAIVHNAFLALGRRGRRMVDPGDRVDYLHEMVVHQARTVRGSEERLSLPPVTDERQQEILAAVGRLPVRFAEPLVVSHYLQTFGPELAGILRLPLRITNTRIEESLRLLSQAAPHLGTGIDSLSQEVVAALTASARTVRSQETEPLEATLAAIRARESSGISPAVLVPLLLVALLAGVWGGYLSVGPRAPAPDAALVPVTPSVSAAASRSLPAQVRGVSVYYGGRADGRLYREHRNLPTSGDVVEAALSAVLAVAPLDPDYASAWGPGELLSAELSDHLLTVDLSPEAYRPLTPDKVALAVNQMVYTAAEVIGDPRLRVTFRMNGAVVNPAVLPLPVDGYATTGLNPMPGLWVNSPKNGDVLASGQIIILGNVKPDFAAPVVVITDESGKELLTTWAQLSTAIDENGWRTWSVSLQLEPGVYQVVARATQVDGAGAPSTASETKAITIE